MRLVFWNPLGASVMSEKDSGNQTRLLYIILSIVERTNKTIVQIIAKLKDPERNQRDGDEQIPFALLAYQSTVHRSTGETPNMMMLGREVELPLDLMIAPAPGNEEQVAGYVNVLRERMQEAWRRARGVLKLSARSQKRNYDQNSKLQTFQENSAVWYYI